MSNHIHLLVADTKEKVIAKSIQLIAGRTGQEFNQRKKRKGAFWEDRYHATTIESGYHLAQCMVYIDLNMVRAGVVTHPAEYSLSGFYEIQNPPVRYKIIDYETLANLFNINDEARFRQEHAYWVEEGLQKGSTRNGNWSESIALGSELILPHFHPVTVKPIFCRKEDILHFYRRSPLISRMPSSAIIVKLNILE